MTDPVVSRGVSWKRHHWWLLSIVFMLIAAGLGTVGFIGRRDALIGPAEPPDSTASAVSGAALVARASGPPSTVGTSTGRAVANLSPPESAPDRAEISDEPASPAASLPVALRIPAIAVSTSLSELGLNPDRTVEVPTDFQQPGWFKLGPTPGQVGSAVILGHVDSFQGPAVFFRLRSLQRGDQVEVGLADGRSVHFSVTAVVTYLKSVFPAEQVYASHGFSALQLVTCGGQFDTRTRSYLSNVVVYTTLSR